MKQFSIKVPVFDQVITLCIGEKKGDEKIALKMAGYEESEGYSKKDTEGFCGDCTIFLWNTKSLNLVVHESSHCAFQLIERCGLPLPNHKNNELSSYLTAFVVDEVMKKLEKYNKKTGHKSKKQ